MRRMSLNNDRDWPCLFVGGTSSLGYDVRRNDCE